MVTARSFRTIIYGRSKFSFKSGSTQVHDARVTVGVAEKNGSNPAGKIDGALVFPGEPPMISFIESSVSHSA